MGVVTNSFLPLEVWRKMEKKPVSAESKLDLKILWITVDNLRLNYMKFTGKPPCFSTLKLFSPQKRRFYPQLWEPVDCNVGTKISRAGGREILQCGQARCPAVLRARGSFCCPAPTAGKGSASFYSFPRI